LNNIREKYEGGDALVIETLAEIADLAQQGKELILTKDCSKLNKLIDKNFDLRCKIMKISDSNMELVMTARKCGASAKFSGSGGAIIGMYEDDEVLQRLIVNMQKINARVIKPIIR
jgi:glucuronokinase